MTDGEQGGMIDEELMASGAGRSGLGRRHLLGGLVAGAAGLLLPAPGVTAQGVTAPELDLRRIRFEIFNRTWGDNVLLAAYWPNYHDPIDPHYTWVKKEEARLNQGSQPQVFEGHVLLQGGISDDAGTPILRVDANGAGWWA